MGGRIQKTMPIKEKKNERMIVPIFSFEEGYLKCENVDKSLISTFKMKDSLERTSLIEAINSLIKKTK